jgi:hypothetical protein
VWISGLVIEFDIALELTVGTANGIRIDTSVLQVQRYNTIDTAPERMRINGHARALLRLS